jgi:hypothetical protein
MTASRATFRNRTASRQYDPHVIILAKRSSSFVPPVLPSRNTRRRYALLTHDVPAADCLLSPAESLHHRCEHVLVDEHGVHVLL